MQEHILLPVEFMQEHKLAIVNIWTQVVHMLVSNKSDWHSQIRFSTSENVYSSRLGGT